MATQSVRVALVQMAMSSEPADNLERARKGILRAKTAGADLVCLPELFACRYFCQTEELGFFDLAEPLDGPVVSTLSGLARSTQLTLLAPIFEKRAPGLYHNSMVVLGPEGESLGLYRKMHIPDDPQFMEKFYFTPGDLGFLAVKTPRVQVGPLICWDQWYPEAARLTALKGAEMLFYPTAIGWMAPEKAEFGEAQLNAWQTIQRSHAIANGVFVVSVNRVGQEPGPEGGIEFWGNSMVVDPFGTVIAKAGLSEELLVVDCDLSLIEQTRRIWPFLRDRRIDAYAGLERRFLDR